MTYTRRNCSPQRRYIEMRDHDMYRLVGKTVFVSSTAAKTGTGSVGSKRFKLFVLSKVQLAVLLTRDVSRRSVITAKVRFSRQRPLSRCLTVFAVAHPLGQLVPIKDKPPVGSRPGNCYPRLWSVFQSRLTCLLYSQTVARPDHTTSGGDDSMAGSGPSRATLF